MLHFLLDKFWKGKSLGKGSLIARNRLFFNKAILMSLMEKSSNHLLYTRLYICLKLWSPTCGSSVTSWSHNSPVSLTDTEN